MNKTTRCKFICTSVTNFGETKEVNFRVVSSGNDEEDKKFHKWTPTGELKFQCLNPAVSFVPQKAYYVDISEVE